MTGVEGPLAMMKVVPADPVRYTAVVGEATVPLVEALGRGLEIRFLGRISCRHCGAVTQRSYGGGYCYPCFKTLARCDLCVVSPDRCHYAAGTCREPEWGEAFCMRPHLVYLANSSGPKVGLTGAGNQVGRWLDQGARQGLVIMSTATRQQAGNVEVTLAALVGDRTDWRALVSGEGHPVDLLQLRDELRERLHVGGWRLPQDAAWEDEQPVEFRYPVQRYPHRIVPLRLEDRDVIRGNLLGIKGQYLLFDHGVFNVRHHTSYHVRLTLLAETLGPGTGDDHQMELFS